MKSHEACAAGLETGCNHPRSKLVVVRAEDVVGGLDMEKQASIEDTSEAPNQCRRLIQKEPSYAL